MSHLYLLGVATLTLTSAGFAGSDTNADLQARLEAAEARISELSAATNANWLNDARADEIRGLVQDVLADADTRANLQGDGATAGYNGGFTVGSADGNWSMTINGLLQSRWDYSDSDAAGTDADWGFSSNRSWLNFSGTVAGDYGYDVRMDMNGSGSDEWAWGSMGLNNGWSLAMGDMVVAADREALIGDGNQMALDRNNGRDVRTGAALHYASDDTRAWVQMFNNGDGEGTANANAYSWNVRVEMMTEGSWGQFDNFSSGSGGAAGTLWGFTYSTDDIGDSGSDNDGDSSWNVDAQMQWGGSAMYISYGDSSDDSDAAGDDNSLQVMYSMDLDNDWELYARMTETDLVDGDVLAIGLNNYLAGNNAKWTTQVSWDDTSGDEVTNISSQLQLMF